MKRFKAAVPAGLSSFFAICDLDEEGRPISNPLMVGAIGGGFKLSPPIRTEVVIEEADAPSFVIFINGRQEEAPTSTIVVRELIRKAGQPPVKIKVYHSIDQPIAAGFGTSGCGAVTLTAALSKALGVNMTLVEIGQLAHMAEVKARTGLGTVGAVITAGACMITKRPGAPGYGLVDSIPMDLKGLKMVVAYFGPLPTKSILARPEIREQVNRAGWRALHRILKDPTPERLLEESLNFAKESRLMTENIKKAIEVIADIKGIVGFAQNMLGDALHILVEEDRAPELKERLSSLSNCRKVLCYDLDDSGLRVFQS